VASIDPGDEFSWNAGSAFTSPSRENVCRSAPVNISAPYVRGFALVILISVVDEPTCHQADHGNVNVLPWSAVSVRSRIGVANSGRAKRRSKVRSTRHLHFRTANPFCPFGFRAISNRASPALYARATLGRLQCDVLPRLGVEVKHFIAVIVDAVFWRGQSSANRSCAWPGRTARSGAGCRNFHARTALPQPNSMRVTRHPPDPPHGELCVDYQTYSSFVRSRQPLKEHLVKCCQRSERAVANAPLTTPDIAKIEICRAPVRNPAVIRRPPSHNEYSVL
jgi:hypothetical protein